MHSINVPREILIEFNFNYLTIFRGKSKVQRLLQPWNIRCVYMCLHLCVCVCVYGDGGWVEASEIAFCQRLSITRSISL